MDLAMDGCIDWKKRSLQSDHGLRERIEKVSDKGLKNEKGVFDLSPEKIMDFSLFVSKAIV